MKSHVSLEQHVCIVCGCPYDTGSILLNRRMTNTLEEHTVTGMGLCPEHLRMHNEGYVALVEAETPSDTSTVKEEDVSRTGRILHIRRTVARKMFNLAFEEDMPMMWIEKRVFDMIEEMDRKRKAEDGDEPDTY